ncbi:MAG: alpha-amylase family glycosyl hydrolase, partial [Anaerolineales bacterium]
DAVINHISRQSDWFQQYLRGEGPYTDYFIEISPETDLSYVVRPRALPLLTPVPALGADGVDGDHGARAEGVRYVWTTFSDDQIDLNYTNPQVLLEIIDVLLFYVSQGAEIIRLDAIAYLWKELDTSCIHLPQTHAVVKLWRAVLDMVAPGVILITETNVPHEENISYFGDEGDEAQMVYQFPLGPLVLHAFHTGNARKLTEWAASLETPSPNTTFFNFIASHDGIGIRPAEGILTPDEVDALVNRTLTHGGQVSYKNNPDGSRSVYELNITLYDWLNNPNQPVSETDVRRFLASQAIMLSLAGVPGIYVHSLFGSRNCHPCVAETGRARSINREKFSSAALEAILNDPGSHQSQVLSGYLRMLHQRREHPAFHPNGANGGQKALSLHDGVFGILRTAPDRSETVLCLVNVSGEKIRVEVDVAGLGGNAHRVSWTDLMGGEEIAVRGGTLKIFLDAYQAVWLTV